jgi:hypothetical protein
VKLEAGSQRKRYIRIWGKLAMFYTDKGVFVPAVYVNGMSLHFAPAPHTNNGLKIMDR